MKTNKSKNRGRSKGRNKASTRRACRSREKNFGANGLTSDKMMGVCCRRNWGAIVVT